MSDNITNMFEAAVAKDKSGEGTEAMRLLDALLEYQPGHRLGLFYRGGVKIRYRKDIDGALKDWEAAFEGAPAGAPARVKDLYPLFLESCLERLINLTGQEPDNACYHSGFGRASLIFGPPELGDRHLRRALQLDPTRGIDGVRLAELLFKQNKKEEALKTLQKQLESSPEFADVQSTLGLYYRGAGMTAQALRHLEAAAALSPRHVPTRQALGEIYLAQGRMDQAESHFKFLLAQAPSAAVHLGLAECDKQNFRYEEAMENHKKAVQIEPQNFQALSELGALALQMGDLELGIRCLKSALHIERGHPEIQGLLAKAALQKGDRQEAVNALRLQLQLDPNDAFASYTLATQLRALGQYQEARDLLLTAMQTRSNDVQLCLDLADCYVELGCMAEATEVLREAYGRNPTREDLRAALGQLDPNLILVPEKKSNQPEVDEWLNLARAHLHGGRSQEAFEIFRKILGVAPQHPEALAHIARIYAGKRVLEAASEFFLRSYSADPTQLPLLLELFDVLNQLVGKQAYAALDQLARCLPQNMDEVAWLDYLWRNKQSPGVGKLLTPLIDSVKKTYPPQHPIAQQWVSLQMAAQK
jgi:tetratricopeptide (TPR) repeat protein